MRKFVVYLSIVLYACTQAYAGDAAASAAENADPESTPDAAASAAANAGADAAADAGESSWLDKVDAVRAPSDHFRFEVAVTAEGGTTLEMAVMVHDRVKSLVRYLRPAKQEGRALLFVERNMWIYIPGSRRPLRISPQQQVLGGVSSADIARIVYSIDYAVDAVEPISSDDPADGPADEQDARYRLRLAAAGEGAAYSRVDLEVRGEQAQPLKSEFYSASRRKLKTVHFENYQEVLGAMRPMTLRVVDHLEGDAETLLRFRNFEIAETPAAWFQPAYLKRLR